MRSTVKKRVAVAAVTVTMLVLIIVICAAVIIINSESDERDAPYYTSGAVAADVGKCSEERQSTQLLRLCFVRERQMFIRPELVEDYSW